MSTVDYRMARRALLRDLRAGLVSVIDVCDAHPELMRAARFIGEATAESCPICEETGLRRVLYTYGKELKGRENGRVRRRSDLLELNQRYQEFACYVVEVCTGCCWNHLVHSFQAGQKHASDARGSSRAFTLAPTFERRTRGRRQEEEHDRTSDPL